MRYNARCLVGPSPTQLICTVCEENLLEGRAVSPVLELLESLAELHYQRVHPDREAR